MDIIKINIPALNELGINAQEYLTLLFLYVNRHDSEGYEEFIKSFGTVSVQQMRRLEEARFIKVPDFNSPEQ